MKIFAFACAIDLGSQIAAHVRVPLSPMEERNFEDGEHKVRPLVAVSGETVFVIQAMYSDKISTVDEKICKLLFFINTLKDAGASNVIAVAPYLAYSRKDRRTKMGDPITGRYLAQLFESVGADAVLTCDVHNLQAFENAYRIPAINVEAASLMVAHLTKIFDDTVPVIVSPDFGGIKRAERFTQLWEVATGYKPSLAFFEKFRSEGNLSGSSLFGNVQKQHVVIVDDMIATGATIDRTAVTCNNAGAASITVVATHGAFTAQADEHLTIPEIQRIIISNTISDTKWKHLKCSEKIVVADVSSVIAHTITSIIDKTFIPGPTSS